MHVVCMINEPHLPEKAFRPRFCMAAHCAGAGIQANIPVSLISLMIHMGSHLPECILCMIEIAAASPSHPCAADEACIWHWLKYIFQNGLVCITSKSALFFLSEPSGFLLSDNVSNHT